MAERRKREGVRQKIGGDLRPSWSLAGPNMEALMRAKMGSWKKQRRSRSGGRGGPAAGGHVIVRVRWVWRDVGVSLALIALGMDGQNSSGEIM